MFKTCAIKTPKKKITERERKEEQQGKNISGFKLFLLAHLCESRTQVF